MNILPKKSWHVRTKQNIARVRRDEAKAAEEEKETQRRIALAAQEARTALLRERASARLAENASSAVEIEDVGASTSSSKGQPPPTDDPSGCSDDRFGIPLGSLKDVVQPDGHVNFFQDVEAGKRQGGTTNEEYEEEKRKEQDDYEKKIGYLVFLGQDSLEQSKEKPWYSKMAAHRNREGLEEELEKVKDLDRAAGVMGGLEEKSKSASVEDIKMTKFKSFLDPLKDIRKYLSTPGIKKKLDSKPSSSSKKSLSSSPPPAKRQRLSSDDKKHSKRKEKKKKSHKSSKKSKKHKRHHKKHRKSSDSCTNSDSDFSEHDEKDKRSNLEKLRQERLEREREERRGSQQVLAKLKGDPVDLGGGDKPTTGSGASSSPVPSMHSVKQKYNSQFNPHLARQNYD